MAAPEISVAGDQNLWAVCPLPNGQDARPKLFQNREDAEAYTEEILRPPMMDGPWLPSPKVMCIPDFTPGLQEIAANGPYCGVITATTSRPPNRSQESTPD